MKIGINTLSVTPQRGGAKTYLTNLLKSLAVVDDKNTYFLFQSPLNESLFSEITGPRFIPISLPLNRDNKVLRLFIEQVIIPIYNWRLGIDLLFSPGNLATLLPGCKQVLVVQGPLTLKEVRNKHAPNEISRFKAWYYDLFVPRSMRKSDMILAVSENLKGYILKHAGVDESKVRVIHEGASLEQWTVSSKDSQVVYPGPYILFVSTLFKYKKADRLIGAFSIFKHRYKTSHKLIIAGRDPGDETVKLQSLSKGKKIKDQVIFLGVVEHEKLAGLYRSADLFVFPSSVETFGLPVLEAMACGIPVVASNRMSVPEVTGDAALIVDPDDVEEMAEAIYRGLVDEGLRESLIKKGYERTKEFSWVKAAKKTLSVIEETHNFQR